MQEPGPVCEDEQLGEVCHRAGALLPPTIRKWSWWPLMYARKTIFGALGAGSKGTAGHQDHTPSYALDEGALLFVGTLYLGERGHVCGIQVVRPRARGDVSSYFTRFGDGAPDQLPARFPPESHSALGRIHGLGDGEPERPEISPVRERRLPVEVDIQGGVVVRQRVADDMGRREGDAATRWCRGRDGH